jgi:DNA processing protein
MITSEEQIRYWLALTALPKIGIQTLLKTANACKVNLSELNVIDSEDLESLGWQSEQIACLREPHPFTQKCLTWLNATTDCLIDRGIDRDIGRAIITYSCKEYPAQLKQIAQAPLILFTDGDYRLLSREQLAVVGSRGPTHSGLTNTHALITDILAQSEFVITSGLALGIDAQSHRTALSSCQQRTQGNTIAVLGNGIDVVYPKRHKDLYEQIRKQGLLVSEFPPGVMPSPKLFPRRNRIISGLSLGTLVTEARIKSGSLVTAKYALEQGREVFAMPSNINNKQAEGCHWLIKQGAKLCECAQDIFDELPDLFLKTTQKQKAEKKPKQNLASTRLLDSVVNTSSQSVTSQLAQNDEIDDSSLLLQAVDFDVTPIDVIAKRTGQSVSTLFVQLLEYELRGFVTSTSEGYLKLRD